jgi:hypothetical protein
MNRFTTRHGERWVTGPTSRRPRMRELLRIDLKVRRILNLRKEHRLGNEEELCSCDETPGCSYRSIAQRGVSAGLRAATDTRWA